MDADFIARITHVAQKAKTDGYEDVAAWMQKHLAYSIRDDRPKRKRGIEVTLGKINRRVKLDEARVKQLLRDGE